MLWFFSTFSQYLLDRVDELFRLDGLVQEYVYWQIVLVGSETVGHLLDAVHAGEHKDRQVDQLVLFPDLARGFLRVRDDRIYRCDGKRPPRLE